MQPGGPETRQPLIHSASARRQQDPILQREASRLALAHRARTFAPQRGEARAELTGTQPANGAIQEGSEAVITPDTARAHHSHPQAAEVAALFRAGWKR